MKCLGSFENNMSLAMGLYDFSPAYRLKCAETLRKRTSSLTWEVWHIILVAPFNPEDEDLHIHILELLALCPDLPKITAPLMNYFAKVVQHPSPKVQEVYHKLLEDLGSEVLIQIFSGYQE